MELLRIAKTTAAAAIMIACGLVLTAAMTGIGIAASYIPLRYTRDRR